MASNLKKQNNVYEYAVMAWLVSFAFFLGCGNPGFSVGAMSTQENLSFTITPELSNKIIEKNQIRQFKIYSVSYKEVGYHALDTGQIMTKEYKYALESLEKDKSEYKLYTNSISSNLEKRESVKIITSNIDKFLNSDEKYEIKQKYLIDSQAFADKYGFSITLKSSNINIPNKTIVIYDRNKRTSKSDLKLYQEAIQKTRIDDPQKTYECKRYLENVEKLAMIKKTETDKVLSNKISKRFTYMINESFVDINSISGTFNEFPETYMLVLSNKDNDRLKNELITKLKYDDDRNERYSIIQKTDTKELYFVMSHNYLSNLQTEQRNQELLTIVHKLGYKEYEGDGNVYIKSKTSEIKLDSWTYQELKKNPSYISTLDNDQFKIAALAKQAIPQSKILYKYAKLYNIKRSKMSSVDINAWKTATANAQKLHNQIYKLNEKYEGNNSFTLLDKSDTLEFFVDNLNLVKGVLGI